MSLLQLIESTPELLVLADANDVAGLVVALNAKTIEKTNSTLQTVWGFGDRYGEEATGVLLTALKAVAAQDVRIDAAYLAFNTRGLDLSNAKLQTQIDTLKVAVPEAAAVFDLLKQMGVWQVSLAEDRLGAEVTAEQVAEALAERSRRSLYEAVAQRYNTTVAAIDAGEVTTLAEAKAFFAGE